MSTISAKSLGLAVALTIAPLGIVNSQPSPLCACTDLEPTLASAGVLAQMDWQSMDRTRLTQLWPTIACEPVAEGPGSQGELTERCCQTCGTCGGALIVDGLDASLVRLKSIGVLLCSDTQDDVIRTLKRLIEETVPATVDASYESPESDLVEYERFKSGYRWQLREETSLLNASVYPWDERWVGTFTLSRCRAPESVEQWALDDGTTVQVSHNSISDTNDERFLNVSYLSECVLADTDCLVAEGERMWPRLKLLAESHEATVVMIVAEDCWSEVQEVTYAIVQGDWMKLRD